MYPIQNSEPNDVIAKLKETLGKGSKMSRYLHKHLHLMRPAERTVIKEEKLEWSLSNTMPAETRIWCSFTTMILLFLL